MKTKSAYRFPQLAATSAPLLAAMILTAAVTSTMAQDSSSTTTTTTTQPTVAPTPAEIIQTTTVTTVEPIALYINKRHGDSLHDGEAIHARADGKVYNNDNDTIGHLTNMEGEDISALPVRTEFKIRNSSGSIIASTRPSSAYDSDRKVLFSRNTETVPATSSTTTTRQTTVPQ
jgi:hypothetical protein